MKPIHITFAILMISLLGLNSHAYAQVEVNMDVLESYHPAPKLKEPRPPLTSPVIKAQKQPRYITAQDSNPPPPKTKPAFKKKPSIAKQGLKQADLANPTPKLAAPKAPKQSPATEPKAKTAEPGPIVSEYFGLKVTVPFLPGVSELSQQNKDKLLSEVIARTRRGSESLIEVHSFASNIDESKSGSRRISLARALEVRGFLTQQGIDSERINLRPLGDQTNISPQDRVDIILVE